MGSKELKFYTVREVAEMLRVDIDAVYRWIWSGKLKAVRIGRDWRINAEVLEKILK